MMSTFQRRRIAAMTDNKSSNASNHGPLSSSSDGRSGKSDPTTPALVGQPDDWPSSWRSRSIPVMIPTRCARMHHHCRRCSSRNDSSLSPWLWLLSSSYRFRRSLLKRNAVGIQRIVTISCVAAWSILAENQARLAGPETQAISSACHQQYLSRASY
jgi:hypothetical protein